MFVQAIRARVKDADAVRAASEGWQRELRPGAKGYLGVTSGITDDGQTITLVRFESEADAQANSERAEQGEWFNNELAPHLEDVRFYNCNEVKLFRGGGDDSAGFVQVMVYKPSDLDAVREMATMFENVGNERPDILGGMMAFASDGTVFDANYFTSEADARANEGKEMSDEMKQAMQKFGEVAGNVEFLDLKDPELRS
jgi:hypothetical protein